MGKKSKHDTEAGLHLSGCCDLQYKDKSCHSVNMNIKTDVKKSVDCKKAKKRKRHKSGDLARQDPANVWEAHHNCACDERSGQEEIFQNDVNYAQYDTNNDTLKKHSRKRKQKGPSDVLFEEQKDVLQRCPSKEKIEHMKKRKKHKDLKRNKKKRLVQVLNLEGDNAVLAKKNSDSAQDCLRLEVEDAESSANGIKTEKRSRKKKYFQQKVSDAFQVENNVVAAKATQDHGQKEAAAGVKEKSLKWKTTEEKITHVPTSFDIDNVAKLNTINVSALLDQKSAQCKLTYSEPGRSESLEKMTRKKKKRNKVRDGCIANEKHGHDSLESNSNIASCVKSGTVTDKLTLASSMNCGNVDSNQQSTSLQFGQWTNVQFDEPSKQSKFLRLLGGMKKSSLTLNNGNQLATSGHEMPAKNVTTNKALTAVQQEHVNLVLERQFDQARDRRFRKQRGAGLGFEHSSDSGKSRHIDVCKVRSKRLDEDD